MFFEAILAAAIAILSSVLGGVIYFIMQRVERLEQDHRDAIDQVFDDIKEMAKDVRAVENRADEKYVTKEYCRSQHRGER
jgi:uncharacterized protein (UPF0335 family)